MGKILIPANGPADWQQFLAEPEKQWKRGYSARTLAHCWHDADGFPKDVCAVLTSSGNFRDIELLVAIPEHKVSLPPVRAQASQNLPVARQGWFQLPLRGRLANRSGKRFPNGWRPQQLGRKNGSNFLSPFFVWDRLFLDTFGINFSIGQHRRSSKQKDIVHNTPC